MSAVAMAMTAEESTMIGGTLGAGYWVEDVTEDGRRYAVAYPYADDGVALRFHKTRRGHTMLTVDWGDGGEWPLPPFRTLGAALGVFAALMRECDDPYDEDAMVDIPASWRGEPTS